MKLKDIRPNLRVQVEIEHSNPSYRTIRGIIIEVRDDSFVLLTDFGEVMEISEGKMLNYSVTQFPRVISDVLQDLRNQYDAIYRLEEEIEERKQAVEGSIERLVDASFLAKFNTHGAKNRLMHSIPKEKREFFSKESKYTISFDSNGNEEIEMQLTISNQIDYPQMDEDRDIERILRVHGPDMASRISKSFPFGKKVDVIDEGVIHERESYYNVRRTYRILFDVDKDNFLKFRENITKGIELLSR